MGILDYNLMNEIAEKCRALKPDFMIYGEGWNMPSFVPEHLRASMLNQAHMPLIGHFSDRFRETCRGSNGDLEICGYSNGDTGLLNSMQQCLGGGCLDHLFDSPQKAINYVECHDNHTLWDKNSVCCQHESRGVLMQRQTLANALVILAQGIPFLHAGQEFGRTKYNLGNSYNRSDHYNHIDYNLRNKHMPIVVDTKLLIKIRKEHPCFVWLQKKRSKPMLALVISMEKYWSIRQSVKRMSASVSLIRLRNILHTIRIKSCRFYLIMEISMRPRLIG